MYLFLERGEGKEKERERNIKHRCLLHTPYRGPGLQSRHMPHLGIELVTLYRPAFHVLSHTSRGVSCLSKFRL